MITQPASTLPATLTATAARAAIDTWLEPFQPVLDPVGTLAWSRTLALAEALDAALASYPLGADLPAGAERGQRLRPIRRDLAERGHLDTTGQPPLLGVVAHFVCGYRDIDLRDATGLGHVSSSPAMAAHSHDSAGFPGC